MYKSKCSIHFVIHSKAGRINPCFCYCIPEKRTELILSHFSDECCFLSHFIQKRQYITGRPSRACFEHSVALAALSVHCEVHQQFSQCDHIIIFLHIRILLL